MEHQSILPRNNKSNHETIEHLTKKKKDIGLIMK